MSEKKDQVVVSQVTKTSPPDLQITPSSIILQPPGFIPPAKPQTSENDASGASEGALLHSASFRSDPLRFLRDVSLHISGSGWRAYENPIGQPILYPGFSASIKSDVLSTPFLTDRIAGLANKRLEKEDTEGSFGDPSHPKYHERKSARLGVISEGILATADRMLDNMMVKFDSKTFVRGGALLATQLTLRAYHQGIHVSSAEVLRLRTVAEKAAKAKQSLVFLPCHRSHVDYVSLQIICFRLGLTLPTVVAGDNLNIPVLGAFLQKCGAMWIRRSFGDDSLYTGLVQAYIDTLLRRGLNLECFIEGGRSRTGKLLPPKFGILSFILDSILSGRVDDCLICPVSTQYDKVIETGGYVDELLGRPKKRENLFDFVTGGSEVLSLRLGRIDVRFHEPWSLRGFITDQLTRLAPDLSGPQLCEGDARAVAVRHKLLRTLGYQVLGDINDVSVVMPTALIGTVLLTLRGRGVGKRELERRVQWLTERVRAKGGRVAHFGNAPLGEIISRGLEVLGPELVKVHNGLLEPVYEAVDRFQLSFYRNMTIHLFISEALVSAAMYTRVKLGGGPSIQDISYEKLSDQVLFLSSLFRSEFIFRGDGLSANLENTLDQLESSGVVRLTRGSDGKVQSVGLSDLERSSGREKFDFYCFLIWPFIESHWLAAVSIMGLGSGDMQSNEEVWVDVSAAQNSAQLFGKTLFHQGDLSYFSSVNHESLKNAYTRFTEEGILQMKKFNDPNSKSPSKTTLRMRLAPSWQPPREATSGDLLACGRLWDFTEKISTSRREGKDRRGGVAVEDRVLKLTGDVGGRLWREARDRGVVGDVQEDPGRTEKRKREGRKKRTLERSRL